MDNARREYVVDLRIDRITTELLNTQGLRRTRCDPKTNGNNWRSPPAGIRCALDKGKVKMEQRPPIGISSVKIPEIYFGDESGAAATECAGRRQIQERWNEAVPK